MNEREIVRVLAHLRTAQGGRWNTDIAERVLRHMVACGAALCEAKADVNRISVRSLVYDGWEGLSKQAGIAVFDMDSLRYVLDGLRLWNGVAGNKPAILLDYVVTAGRLEIILGDPLVSNGAPL